MELVVFQRTAKADHLAVDAAAHFVSCEFTTWRIHHTHQTWNIITQSLQRHTIFHSSK